jgi:ATP-dependent Clp protease, protease subunit
MTRYNFTAAPRIFAGPHDLLQLYASNRRANAHGRGLFVRAADPDSDGDDDPPGKPDDDEASIYVYDVIGDWFGVSARDLAPRLEAITASTIRLHINSPGGDVFEARAMKTLLEQHSARVKVQIDGLAASAASFLMLAGDEISIAKGAFVMIHNPWGVAIGDAMEMRATAQLLDQVRDTIAADYVAKTGIASAEIMQMMDVETWMDADTAVTKKFCDACLDKAAKAASNASKFDLSAFANAPKAALEPAPSLDAACESARARQARIASMLAREPA